MSDNVPIEEDAADDSGTDEIFELDDNLKITADQEGQIIHYTGADTIPELPTRNDLVITAGAIPDIASGGLVYFMPCDVEDATEYLRGSAIYILRLYGTLMDGSKACVTITDIEVFFDVKVPEMNGFDLYLRKLLIDAAVKDFSIQNIAAYPGRGYHATQVAYKRVQLQDLQQRKKAVAAIIAAGLTTASDDRTCYYRKAAREYGLPLSDWAMLTDYGTVSGSSDAAPLCKYNFRIHVKYYKPLIDTMAPIEIRAAAQQIKDSNPLLARDRTLVLTWDIETYSGRGIGDVPSAEHKEDNCFMIAITAHWKDDPAPLVQICIVDVDVAGDPAWITVICKSPINVLRAFALCWRSLSPDIQSGFNDSNYDWPFVINKAKEFKILGWMFNQMSASPRKQVTDDTVMQWQYNTERKIKITAEEVFFSSYLKVPGCVPIDVRVCYKKLYPKSETPKAGSLKFYLEISGLASKADMPIKRMWQYYKAALAAPTIETAEHMRHVSHYCIIDAVRCQQLLVRRNIINDYREVSTLAFVSLFDSHYYAGGMKVCNLLGAYAARRNILVSMIPAVREETGKYPGAFVFPPEKGIAPNPERLLAIEAAAAAASAETIAAAFQAFATDRPVTGLDFASLYPSLIMTYNLSLEKILLNEVDATYWESQGRKLHKIEFPFNGRTIRGWSISHENCQEDIGLFPSVLIDLFNKRAEVKKILGKHGATKELIEVINGRAKKDGSTATEAAKRVYAEAALECKRTEDALVGDVRISPGGNLAEELADLKRLNRNAREQMAGIDQLPTDIQAEYARVCFDWTCANTKQNALKVYMNTFYGETGNSLSPFFLLQLAGGVTSAGQYNIKLVADFVRSKGYHIKYGDTDSLYLVAPGEYFTECDAEYAASKLTREDWWSAMVRITMRALNQIRDEVNATLRADNGSKYLKMAYEEVLYPVVFTGKKKYFGIPHLNEVNFRPKKLFIRGIDVVKQGQPGLARDIGYGIMWACMAIDNTRSLRNIVEDALREAVLVTKWDFEHFIKTDAWKPNKNNQPVHRFISRMRARHAIEVAESTRTPLYTLPEAGERFSYVIVRTGADFDLHGRKFAPKKGDIMEFAHAAKALSLEIDVAYYMVRYVVGLCARFINGDAEFQPPPCDDEKRVDELSQKAAKKTLEAFIKGLSNLDSTAIRKRGYAYRRAYTRAVANTTLVGTAAKVLHGDWINFELFGDEPVETMNALWVAADNCASFVDSDVSWHPIVANKIDVVRAAAVRSARDKNICHTLRGRLKYLAQSEIELRSLMNAMLPQISDIAARYEADLTRLVTNYRHDEHITHPEIGTTDVAVAAPAAATVITDADRTVLLEFHRLWLSAVALQMVRHQDTSFEKYLQQQRTKRLGGITTPVGIPAIIADAASKRPIIGNL